MYTSVFPIRHLILRPLLVPLFNRICGNVLGPGKRKHIPAEVTAAFGAGLDADPGGLPQATGTYLHTK